MLICGWALRLHHFAPLSPCVLCASKPTAPTADQRSSKTNPRHGPLRVPGTDCHAGPGECCCSLGQAAAAGQRGQGRPVDHRPAKHAESDQAGHHPEQGWPRCSRRNHAGKGCQPQHRPHPPANTHPGLNPSAALIPEVLTKIAAPSEVQQVFGLLQLY